MQVPMISTMRQTYRGRSLRSEEPFEAVDEADAADMVAVNMARRDPKRATQPTAAPVLPQRTTITRDMAHSDASEADEPAPIGDGGATEAAANVAAEAARPSGLQSSVPHKDDRYNRRDIRAKR